LLTWLLLTVAAGLIQAAPVAPSEKDSHERYLEEVRSATATAKGDIVKRYQAYIREHPDDLQAYIEECKFLERVGMRGEDHDDEDDDAPSDNDQLKDCLAALLKTFPNDPQAVLYRATRLYGQEKILFLEGHVRANGAFWPKEAVADCWQALAWDSYYRQQLAKAAAAAAQAMKLDPKRHLSLIVAEYYQTMGQKLTCS
jgi:hypothetical protein